MPPEEEDFLVMPLFYGGVVNASQNLTIPLIPNGSPGSKPGSMGLDSTGSVYVRGIDGTALNLNSSSPVFINLTVGGTTNLSGPTTISSTLTVTGTVAMGGPTTISSTLTVTGNTTLNTLSVTGPTTLGGLTTVADLTATGNTDLDTLYVNGDATLAGLYTQINNLTCVNPANFGSIIVAGKLQMSNQFADTTPNVLNVTYGTVVPSNAGTYSPGSLHYDTTGTVLWISNGTAWSVPARHLLSKIGAPLPTVGSLVNVNSPVLLSGASDEGGVISATPTAAGNFSFVVTYFSAFTSAPKVFLSALTNNTLYEYRIFVQSSNLSSFVINGNATSTTTCHFAYLVIG